MGKSANNLKPRNTHKEQVVAVPSSASHQPLTTSHLRLADRVRIGFGYDVHRLKMGRRCVLCGVEIPAGFGPDGHSDADAPLHALMDALLGALALGDIGKYFPDSDERWYMASSLDLLKSVYEMVCERGYALGNADITIILESPRLSPYIDQMRAAVAGALDADITAISVKATTEEKLGFTGDGAGIAASAAVLLTRSAL